MMSSGNATRGGKIRMKAAGRNLQGVATRSIFSDKATGGGSICYGMNGRKVASKSNCIEKATRGGRNCKRAAGRSLQGVAFRGSLKDRATGGGSICIGTAGGKLQCASVGAMRFTRRLGATSKNGC